jgi:hypothetical protein
MIKVGRDAMPGTLMKVAQFRVPILILSIALVCLVAFLLFNYRGRHVGSAWRADFRMKGHPWCWVADVRGDNRTADAIVAALAAHGIGSIAEGKSRYLSVGVRLEDTGRAAEIIREIAPTLRDAKVRLRDDQGNWLELKLND